MTRLEDIRARAEADVLACECTAILDRAYLLTLVDEAREIIEHLCKEADPHWQYQTLEEQAAYAWLVKLGEESDGK